MIAVDRTRPLSPRMAQLVDAVGKLTAKHGYPPTVRELAEEIKVAPGRAATLAARCPGAVSPSDVIRRRADRSNHGPLRHAA